MERRASKKPTTSDLTISSINFLIDLFPDSHHFLGKEIYFSQPKSILPFKKKKRPDLNGIREEIHRFSEREVVSSCRAMINKRLKQHPYLADLHALKAIQIFHDLSQSGINQNKLDILADSLIKISKALHNEGLSIFNATWFVTIYLRYLELIRERLSREYNYGIHHHDPHVRQTTEKLYQKLLKIPRLIQVKNNLVGLTNLNVKLKGTGFVTDCISMHDLKSACEALAGNKPDKMIGSGKPAGSILSVIWVLCSVFARIPILSELVKNTLKSIPDLTRDLVLQKHMIRNTTRINDFQLAVASGNNQLGKNLASLIYDSGLKAINTHLENAILTKQYEVDPFLKVAWIAKESRDIIDQKTVKGRLAKSLQILDIVQNKRCRHAASLEIATRFQTEIRNIIADYEQKDESENK
ncbi:MAG: hypothetical protein GY866_14865 [Proteobacteria bacterium]|nr:hypothetical protein [Pseudomonadota bacterium]